MILGPKKGWVASAEQKIFGGRKTIRISSDVLQLRGPALTNIEATLKLPAPVYTINGLKVWFLSVDTLKTIGRKSNPSSGIEPLMHPGIFTAEGIAGSMFAGQSMPTKGGMTPVGFGMKCAAYIHDDYVELLAEIVQSEFRVGLVQTNLGINARLNVTKPNGVFMVQAQSTAATNGWGVIIHWR